MNRTENIILTETPRDATQAWPRHIPAGIKAKYINALLKVGFDTLDCGSFVSAKAVPQMADTAEVLSLIEVGNSNTKLMVIVGNTRGGRQAASESKVDILGFPYSVSPTFLKRNLNTTPEEAWKTMLELKTICTDSGRGLRVYVAMAFGNPYGDLCNNELVLAEVEKLCQIGIHDLVFSDITGEGTPESIGRLCADLVESFPELNPGIHLHTSPLDWKLKIEAAWDAGFRRFESALGGYGGCPMTGYELLANLDTLALVNWCEERQIPSGLNFDALKEAQQIATEVFI